MDHLYSLAVEAGFYGHASRVAGAFIKLTDMLPLVPGWVTISRLISFADQGPVVQSIVSLMSSLVIKMLSVLVSTISNSQLFLLEKCE